jgi:hypothetical protein
MEPGARWAWHESCNPMGAMNALFARLLLIGPLLGGLFGCGIEVPVSEVWLRSDNLPRGEWNKELASRLTSFQEPLLTESQRKFSAKFSPSGIFGRKFLWVIDADREMFRAIQKVPKGLARLCPYYGLLPSESKALVWTSVLDALSFSEARYNSSLTSVEKFTDVSGAQVVSTGLFQISWASASRHGASCSGATTDKLKDKNFNVLCAFRILSNQIHRTGVLFYEDRKFYYWSALSRGRNPEGFGRFMGRLSLLMKDSQRWPQACGLPDKF